MWVFLLIPLVIVDGVAGFYAVKATLNPKPHQMPDKS
jgi:hypothetical protein